MRDPIDRFHVLTGGPGSGKTTLIHALKARGYATTPEAGRTVIREQLAVGGKALPWTDPQLFAKRMLTFDLRNYAEALKWSGPVFFDRGVPDVVCYLELCNLPVPAAAMDAVDTYRYARGVFILPPWPDIFREDAERKQSFEEAERTYRAMIAVYSPTGYDLVEVPQGPVDARADFVLARIGL